MGSPNCRVVGKPAGEWENGDEDLRYFNADLFAQPRPRGGAAAAIGTERNSGKASEDAVRLVGASGSFNVVRHLVDRVASTDATVLFVGESGVGREIFARTLHRVSKRSSRPFIALNCAAIPDNLIESELFGVEKGAFTRAMASRPGRFERANGGTLFLDEVASLSMVAQGKLLRAVQEREVERVGGIKTIPTNVRILAASNRELRDEVKAGRSREDLFFRLNVFPINIPPLRERRDDIPLLMEAFANRCCDLHGKRITGFTQRAVEALLRYDFPGNIRELQNIVERAVILTSDGFPIDVSSLSLGEAKSQFGGMSLSAAGRLTSDGPVAPPIPPMGVPLSTPAQQFSFTDHEAQIYTAALGKANGNVAQAARSIGLTRAQLSYRLKKSGKK